MRITAAWMVVSDAPGFGAVEEEAIEESSATDANERDGARRHARQNIH